MLEHVKHTFEPIFDQNSKILILGTFPSVKSREGDFYYGHPRNRFWLVLANILRVETPETIDEKKKMLLEGKVAIWDVIESCDIKGSSDSSIRNVVPADINKILNKAPIVQIYANGEKAFQLYMKYCFADTKRDIIKLPSTSPANAAWSIDRLIARWRNNIVNNL
ncbi:MAG: DNA-deoxyinosine glycosylase [Lachnospiraceae bacterium]